MTIMTPKAVFKILRTYCLAKEGATEDYPWGDVIWKVNGKIFVGCDDELGEYTVKASLPDQAKLIRKPGVRVADYVGRFGWVTITVASARQLKLAKELIDNSYASVAAGKKGSNGKKRNSTGGTRSRRRT